MSKIRDFYTRLPEACGVPEDLAAIYADHLGQLFDHEAKNPESVLARKLGQSVAGRLKPAFAGWDEFAQVPEVEYGKRLAIYAAAMYGWNSKDDGDPDELETEREYLASYEPEFPKIAALMTVDEASTLSNWI